VRVPIHTFCPLHFLCHSGNFSFVDVVGSVEPTWNCTLKDGSHIEVSPPTDQHPEKCEQLKSDCVDYEAVQSSEVEFYSIVASFKLICDDENKPEIIQTIQAIALVSSILLPFVMCQATSRAADNRLRRRWAPGRSLWQAIPLLHISVGDCDHQLHDHSCNIMDRLCIMPVSQRFTLRDYRGGVLNTGVGVHEQSLPNDSCRLLPMVHC
jgi:hypothetical protein